MIRTCPACGTEVVGEPYDIGDGPEFACPSCEWCWGANSQPLTDAVNDWARELAQTTWYDRAGGTHTVTGRADLVAKFMELHRGEAT